MTLLATSDRPISWTMETGSPAQRIDPVTLAFVKTHLRFGPSTEDALIAGWIAAATSIFEAETGRQVLQSTREYALAGAPCQRVIEIPRPPLLSVTSIKYDDASGTEQTIDADDYVVHASRIDAESGDPQTIDPRCAPGRVELAAIGATWPVTSGLERSLRIQYVCGYGETVADVPAEIQTALLLLVGHFFTNREEVIIVSSGASTPTRLPLGAMALIDSFKYSALPTLAPPRAV